MRPKSLQTPVKMQLNPLNSVKVFADKESCILILYGVLIYANTYMVVSTLPPQLEKHCGLNTLHISLCFLATGFGTMTAVILTGHLLDWNFR